MVFCCSSESLSDSVAVESPGKHGLPYWGTVQRVGGHHARGHTHSPKTVVPPPSLSLHPSQGVLLGDTVTLRCHLPRMAAWVQLWFNGTLRSDKAKDKEQDTA
ncbi:hypothetical protein CIB84_016075, partial [Bambusicola thoracicus]